MLVSHEMQTIKFRQELFFYANIGKLPDGTQKGTILVT